MRVAYLRKVNSTQLRDEPLPVAGKNQIVLEVQACAICGTDLHAAAANEEFLPFGHEIAGRVAEMGEGVETLEIGQNVVLDSATPCGRCAMCRNMRQELCTDIQSFFYLGSFGMAQYMLAPAISAIPYEGLRPCEATLSEPLGVALDVVRVADIEPGCNVLVMGPGPIGLMAVRLARRAGAEKVFVSALSGTTARNRLALEFGADAVIEVDRQPLADYDFGCRIDRVVSTTPPSTLRSAIDVACKGATIAYIGLAGNSEPEIRFNADEFHFKKLQLRASFASPALFGPRALEILKRDVLMRQKLISHRFSLDEIQKAMETAGGDIANAVKVVVEP
ncbi:MAG: alcohol dehydrogenase catalytic domain-containing protein [Planctomycetota bacterium]|nr:alcohol dehydrogenase catalytic domain-containing protein [Planctomycetota bacterium]